VDSRTQIVRCPRKPGQLHRMPHFELRRKEIGYRHIGGVKDRSHLAVSWFTAKRFIRRRAIYCVLTQMPTLSSLMTMIDSLVSLFNSLLRLKNSLFKCAGNSPVTHCCCYRIPHGLTALARRSSQKFPVFSQLAGKFSLGCLNTGEVPLSFSWASEPQFDLTHNPTLGGQHLERRPHGQGRLAERCGARGLSQTSWKPRNAKAG
jgi:hypothetical protein